MVAVFGVVGLDRLFGVVGVDGVVGRKIRSKRSQDQDQGRGPS